MEIRKNLLLGCLLMLICQISIGQSSFSHSFGGSIYVSAAGNPGAPGLTYSPRINFVQLSDETTISIGTHFGLGLVYNSRGEGGNAFAIDLPLVVEYNFGHGANPDTDSSFGGFAGLGLGFNQIGADGSEGGTNTAAGLFANAGIRTIFREKAIGLRVSYLLNSKENNENVIGATLFYTFGNY